MNHYLHGLAHGTKLEGGRLRGGMGMGMDGYGWQTITTTRDRGGGESELWKRCFRDVMLFLNGASGGDGLVYGLVWSGSGLEAFAWAFSFSCRCGVRFSFLLPFILLFPFCRNDVSDQTFSLGVT